MKQTKTIILISLIAILILTSACSSGSLTQKKPTDLPNVANATPESDQESAPTDPAGAIPPDNTANTPSNIGFMVYKIQKGKSENGWMNYFARIAIKNNGNKPALVQYGKPYTDNDYLKRVVKITPLYSLPSESNSVLTSEGTNYPVQLISNQSCDNQAPDPKNIQSKFSLLIPGKTTVAGEFDQCLGLIFKAPETLNLTQISLMDASNQQVSFEVAKLPDYTPVKNNFVNVKEPPDSFTASPFDIQIPKDIFYEKTDLQSTRGMQLGAWEGYMVDVKIKNTDMTKDVNWSGLVFSLLSVDGMDPGCNASIFFSHPTQASVEEEFIVGPGQSVDKVLYLTCPKGFLTSQNYLTLYYGNDAAVFKLWSAPGPSDISGSGVLTEPPTKEIVLKLYTDYYALTSPKVTFSDLSIGDITACKLTDVAISKGIKIAWQSTISGRGSCNGTEGCTDSPDITHGVLFIYSTLGEYKLGLEYLLCSQ